MTEEKIIRNNGEIPYDELKKERLNNNEASSDETDLSASIKLVDSNGTVYILIECESQNMCVSDEMNYNNGCFIRRFEFDPRLINSQILTNFINSFVTAVKYSLPPVENGRFRSRYRYIWAQVNTSSCNFIEILGLHNDWETDGIITFKLQLPPVD